jgi:hypothetical protein
VTVTVSAPVFSSIRVTRFVPGMITMSSPLAGSHASATCAAVAPVWAAMAWTSSARRRLLEVVAGEARAGLAEVGVVEARHVLRCA